MTDAAPPPLKPHWFHILTAVAERDLHGSGIVRDVLDQTDGELRLWPGTLYGSLEDLAATGLIRELAGEEHPDGASGRRRYYRITPEGLEALRLEATRLAALAGIALERVRGC